jgi:UDPglucose--hexose-1-phosphate uridylyltransferase
MRKTPALMADGRELFYFDDVTPTREVLPDTRDLPHVTHGSTMRFDVLTGEWVTIAAHRQDRTYMPPADHCPLCPTKPGREPSEIPAPSYDVVVFENRFPSFTQTAPDVPSEVDGNSLWPQRPAVGRCEVVCFTSDHNASFGSLPVSRVRTVIEAWADRTETLSALPGVEQVFPFENRGKEIGVTLQHPHGQIYAYPFVTPRTASLITRAGAHRQRTGRDLMGDVLDSERKSGARIVLDGDAWTCFVPAAARWPVEAHLVPHRAVPDFAALNEAERDELAVLYRDLLYRLERVFGEPMEQPYIAGWHQAPVHTGRDLTRLHLQLFSLRRAPGKLKYLAGSESGVGAWINDVTPEQIAERLRAAGS